MSQNHMWMMGPNYTEPYCVRCDECLANVAPDCPNTNPNASVSRYRHELNIFTGDCVKCHIEPINMYGAPLDWSPLATACTGAPAAAPSTTFNHVCAYCKTALSGPFAVHACTAPLYVVDIPEFTLKNGFTYENAGASTRPRCTDCARELSSTMDAYYGRDEEEAAKCSGCRR